MYRRLKEMREDRDLPQKELAKHLNCTQVCYSRYALIKLAEFYGTSTDYLLGLTDEARPYPRKKKREEG